MRKRSMGAKQHMKTLGAKGIGMAIASVKKGKPIIIYNINLFNYNRLYKIEIKCTSQLWSH